MRLSEEKEEAAAGHLISGFVRRSVIIYGIVRARWSMAWIRIASLLPVSVTL